MSDQATSNTDGEKQKSGCGLCCCKGGSKSKKQAAENDIVVTNQPGTEAVVIKQPQSNGHQRSFTIEDCSYIDEGNETFEEKKWKENGGASITIKDVSGVKVEGPDSIEGESKR